MFIFNAEKQNTQLIVNIYTAIKQENICNHLLVSLQNDNYCTAVTVMAQGAFKGC